MGENWISPIFATAFLGTLTLAMVSDLRTRRIPNALTLSALVIALLVHSAWGPGAVVAGLRGAGLGLLVGVPLFAMGAMGGGDVKLLVAVGAFLGPQKLLLAFVLTALAGGALALLFALRQGGVLPLLRSTAEMLRYFVTFGRAGKSRSLALSGTLGIPYAVAISIGSTLAWLV